MKFELLYKWELCRYSFIKFKTTSLSVTHSFNRLIKLKQYKMACGARAAVILGVLILGLFVAEMEAKSCCKTTFGRNCYNTCRLPCKIPAGVPCPPRAVCAASCSCKIVSGRCPPDYPKSMLEDASEAAIGDYCKLGCESSACSAMSIINDNTGEGKEAMEECKNACSEICVKGASSSE